MSRRRRGRALRTAERIDACYVTLEGSLLGALAGDTCYVCLGCLVECCRVESHALGEAALLARAERGAGAGDALGEALRLARVKG